jgi:hypothetical protein
MSKVSNEQILNWVSADDTADQLRGLPSHVQEAGLAAERKDRIELVQTAIDVQLLDHLEEAEQDIRTASMRRDTIISLLSGSEKPAVRIAEDETHLITPFTLLTGDTRYVACHGMTNVSGGVASRELRGKINEVIGDIQATALTGVMKFILRDKPVDDIECVERGNGFISFLSENPKDYSALLDANEAGLGVRAVNGVIRLAQNFPANQEQTT